MGAEKLLMKFIKKLSSTQQIFIIINNYKKDKNNQTKLGLALENQIFWRYSAG